MKAQNSREIAESFLKDGDEMSLSKAREGIEDAALMGRCWDVVHIPTDHVAFVKTTLESEGYVVYPQQITCPDERFNFNETQLIINF